MPYGIFAIILLAAGLMTSCAQPLTTPVATTAAEQCQQNRGAAWRPAVSYCEYGSVQ